MVETALFEATVTVSPGSVAFTSILVVSDTLFVAKLRSALLLTASFIVPPFRFKEPDEAICNPPDISPSPTV